MTCTKCRCYFCWLCNELVSRSNPYAHFNKPGSQCYNKLFQGVDVEDEEWQNDWLEDDYWKDTRAATYILFICSIYIISINIKSMIILCFAFEYFTDF